MVKKIIIIHLAFLMLVIAAGAYAYLRYWNVATVDGTPISRIDYIKNMEKQGGKQTLEAMIDETLVLNEAKAKKVNIEQKTIDEELAKIEEQLKGQGQTLETALASAGMTKAELEKQIRIRQIQTVLAVPKVEVTQEQVDAFLKANEGALPKGATKEELQSLAKEQILQQSSQNAVSNWLGELRKNAKVIYK